MRRKIGLFFGSFNPVHVGHLIIANYMVGHTYLDEVWFVVSPQNPFKDKKNLADKYDRLEMVRLAIKDAENLKVSDIEFSLPRPSYTVDTLAHLREQYPDRDFSLIMGADNLAGLHKWKNADIILRNHHILVYPRPGFANSELEGHPAVTMTQTPLMELASTFIRQAVKERKSIQFYVPDKVVDFIEKKSLYH